MVFILVNIYLNITCTVPHVSAFKSHKVGSREDPAPHYFVISFSASYLLPGLFLIGFSTGFSSPLTSIYVTEACISIIVPQNRQISMLSPNLNNFELVVLQVIILNWLSYKLLSRWRVPAIKGLSHQSSTVSSLLDFSSSIWFT